MVTQKLVGAAPPPQQTGGSSAPTPLRTDVYNDFIGGTISTVRKEIDDAFEDMKQFDSMEPDEIMRVASGQSARLSEIRVRIFRIEDFHREWRNIRIREIEPALEELREQWKNASRLHSVRELDWKMESGER